MSAMYMDSQNIPVKGRLLEIDAYLQDKEITSKPTPWPNQIKYYDHGRVQASAEKLIDDVYVNVNYNGRIIIISSGFAITIQALVFQQAQQTATEFRIDSK